MSKITKDTTLSEVMNKEGILSRHGVPCVTCPYAKMEMDKLKLGDVAKMYGIDLEKLLKDLNKK